VSRNVVLASPEQSKAAREALLRAIERLPATVEEIPPAARAARLKELAADAEIESIVLVDADAVLTADAFGALRRADVPGSALIGGRALIGAGQRMGAMFGPSRSGPNPFDLVPLIGPQSDRHFPDLVRGPVDAPQRGAVVVSGEFVRALGDVALDPVVLHLDLAVYARAAGRMVVCEPSMTFHAVEDSLELNRALGDLRRYAGIGTWKPQELHRDPPRLRSAFITRAVRVMGNIRGYARQPYPLLDVLVPGVGELGRARALRAGVALGATGTVNLCAPEDGDALRTALARTSDRYLLVVDANAVPDRACVEVLVERLERSGRIGLAFERAAAPYGAALFHCGRIANAAKLPGATIADVIAGAVEFLPRQRLFAATPAGEIVPAAVPPLPGIGRLDAVFIAASKPAVTEQTVRALMGERVDGDLSVVYPAGATTTERLLAVHSSFRLIPDDSDVQLAVGLNRALSGVTSDAVAIVRDDVQLPHGFLERLKDAFRRIPRLGVAVPRVGGLDRPESLPDLGYRSSVEMQALYDRRAEAFAREASLLDVATAPVMIVSREALELVGGFDEMFGFSRCGIEDFTRRIRAANYLVACCDDAYAHLFPTDEAGSFVGNLDDAPFLRVAYEKRWAEPRGFDPESDRVPLRDDPAGPQAAVERRGVRVLLPLQSEEEWQRARPLLVALAAAFRVTDPVEVAVGLDGTYGLQTALGALREVLFASGVPMDETLNVSIDFVPDTAVWRDAGENNVRVAGLERDSLLELPVVDGVAALRAYLTAPVA
jgi:hypothetical protein